MRETLAALTNNPMQIVRRYVFALIGGLLAMVGYVLAVFRSETLFSQQSLSSALGNGLIFGHLLAFLVIFASAYPRRLTGIWTFPARLAFASVVGVFWSGLAWGAYFLLLLAQVGIEVIMILPGTIGLSAGFIISGVWRLPFVMNVLLTTVAIYLPILVTNLQFQANPLESNQPVFLYFDPFSNWQLFVIGIAFALCIAFFGHLPQLWEQQSSI